MVAAAADNFHSLVCTDKSGQVNILLADRNDCTLHQLVTVLRKCFGDARLFFQLDDFGFENEIVLSCAFERNVINGNVAEKD